MIGGFLGAGKTTALAAYAQELHSQGLKVGLITNDQGSHLVDTQMLRSKGFTSAEIAGGCFCCRFDSLASAAQQLTEQTKPDVFLAEPVGSCTDLMATVSYPLRRIYGDQFELAPLSVIIDPIRALRVLGLDSQKKSFSAKVNYIYLKQLEEADIIVINKIELLDTPQLDLLTTTLQQRFPQATIHNLSLRNSIGLHDWFTSISTMPCSQREAMPIDYDIYAEGEALLGWLNAEISLTLSSSISSPTADEFLENFAKTLQIKLLQHEAEIAHLKMTYSPNQGLAGEVAIINLVRNDHIPELCQTIDSPLQNATLTLNCRAELDPDLLHQSLLSVIDDISQKNPILNLEIIHQEFFRPGKPTPTHRDLQCSIKH